MYPLAVILLVTLIRKTAPPFRTSVILAAAGGVISIYHYTTQWFPSLDSGVCAAAVPCSAPYFMRLGWISIPYMAASAFLLIVVLLISLRTRIRATDQTMEAAV
jgi:disulfide bond formation protein DsbB